MSWFGKKESAESKLQKSEQENTKLKSEINSYVMNIKALSQEKNYLERQVEALKSENYKLNTQLSNSKAQIESLSKANSMQSNARSGILSGGYPQQGMVNSYQTQIRVLESQLKDSNSASLKLREDLNIYIEHYKRLDSANNELRGEINSIKANTEIILKESETRNEHEANEYKKEIKKLTEELKSSKISTPNLSETNIVLTMKIKELSDKIAELEKDNNEKAYKIKICEAEIEKYKKIFEGNIDRQMEMCSKLINNAVVNSRTMADKILMEKQAESGRLNSTPQEQSEILETLTMNYNKILKENEILKAKLRSALIRLD